LDVTSSQDVRRLRREIDPIDILVNNAGIVTGGSFVDVAVDQHEAVFAVNAVGPMLVMHTFLPGLIRRPEAHLVTIASASSFLPMPLQVSYAASKWAALGLSDAIRQELRIMGNKHVRVTAVCPSYIDTEMFQGARMPFLTRALPPRLVAHSVVRAVKRNKNHLLMPWPVHLICLGKALLPLWLGEKICDWFGITNGMSTWIGHQGKTQEAAATIPVQLGSLSEVQVKQG
jgi:short-subunit dehydrogenase